LSKEGCLLKNSVLVSYWLLGTGLWHLAAGYWFLAAGLWPCQIKPENDKSKLLEDHSGRKATSLK
jgi:hypothetical protein